MREVRLVLWNGLIAILSIPTLRLALEFQSSWAGNTQLQEFVDLSFSYPYVLVGSFLTALAVHHLADGSATHGAFYGAFLGPLNAPLSFTLLCLAEHLHLWWDMTGPSAWDWSALCMTVLYGWPVALPCGILLGALAAVDPSSFLQSRGAGRESDAQFS